MKRMTPIILILLAVGIFFFFIDPENKEVKKLIEVKKQNELTLENARKLSSEKEDLKKRYESIDSEKQATLEKILPNTVDNVRLLLDINNIADDRGIALKGLSVSGGPIGGEEPVNSRNGESKSTYGTITMSFSVTASYDVFKKFMYDLESSLRLVDITEFSVSAAEGSDKYGYSVTLNTYWLR